MLEMIMMKLLLGGLHLFRYISMLDHIRMIHNTYRDYEDSIGSAREHISKHAHLVELQRLRSMPLLFVTLLKYYPDQMAILTPRLLQTASMFIPQLAVARSEPQLITETSVPEATRRRHTEIIDE